MKKNRIKIRLLIHGYSCEPENITEIIGLQPTRTWEIGDVYGIKMIKKFDYNGWELAEETHDVDGDFYYQLEETAERFLIKIEQKLDNFSNLPLNSEVEFSCIISANEFVPAMGFSAKTISMLAKINAYIDIDLYDNVKINKNT